MFGFGKRYKVEYIGGKSCFVNAQDSYKAGQRVEIYYPYVATDTNYDFFVDGLEVNPSYEDGKGYVISFTMPEHDIKVECSSKNTMLIETPPKIEDIMLIDYYRATVATVGGDDYREIAVFEYGNGKVKLKVFQKVHGSDETCTTYIVPDSVVKECRKVIKKHNFSNWKNLKDGIGLCGAVTVVKYREKNGDYIRVSTENMPPDGDTQLSEVGTVLRRYVKEEYKQS